MCEGVPGVGEGVKLRFHTGGFLGGLVDRHLIPSTPGKTNKNFQMFISKKSPPKKFSHQKFSTTNFSDYLIGTCRTA